MVSTVMVSPGSPSPCCRGHAGNLRHEKAKAAVRQSQIEDNAYRCGPGTIIANRFEVLEEVGTGHFARVVSAIDHTDDTIVAVKLLKSEYVLDAKCERCVLQQLTQADPACRYKTMQLYDHFSWKGLCCFVLPLLGNPISTRPFGVGENRLSKRDVALLGRQLGESLSFLHDVCRLVHTDLKPDNILLDDPDDDSSGLGEGWTIADFGSASFLEDGTKETDIITTRPYRAPEVVLHQGWDYAADMWSVGCILYEVYTGRRLFDVPDCDNKHLMMIQRKIGRIPYPDCSNSESSGWLEKRISDPLFLDLLKALLTFDPKERMTASELLDHPFIIENTKERSLSFSSSSPCSSLSSRPPSCAGKPMDPPPVKHASKAGGEKKIFKGFRSRGDSALDNLCNSIRGLELSIRSTASTGNLENGKLSLKQRIMRKIFGRSKKTKPSPHPEA